MNIKQLNNLLNVQFFGKLVLIVKHATVNVYLNCSSIEGVRKARVSVDCILKGLTQDIIIDH